MPHGAPYAVRLRLGDLLRVLERGGNADNTGSARSGGMQDLALRRVDFCNRAEVQQILVLHRRDVDRAALDRALRVAARHGVFAYRSHGQEAGVVLRKRSRRDRLAHCQQVGLHDRDEVQCFRVAEASVELDDLLPGRRRHVLAVQDAFVALAKLLEKRSGRCLVDFLGLGHIGGAEEREQVVRARVAAHAACVGP